MSCRCSSLLASVMHASGRFRSTSSPPISRLIRTSAVPALCSDINKKYCNVESMSKIKFDQQMRQRLQPGPEQCPLLVCPWPHVNMLGARFVALVCLLCFVLLCSACFGCSALLCSALLCFALLACSLPLLGALRDVRRRIIKVQPCATLFVVKQ